MRRISGAGAGRHLTLIAETAVREVAERAVLRSQEREHRLRAREGRGAREASQDVGENRPAGPGVPGAGHRGREPLHASGVIREGAVALGVRADGVMTKIGDFCEASAVGAPSPVAGRGCVNAKPTGRSSR